MKRKSRKDIDSTCHKMYNNNMKKIIILSFAAITAAFGAYKAFNDLAKAMDSWDTDWAEAEETD